MFEKFIIKTLKFKNIVSFPANNLVRLFQLEDHSVTPLLVDSLTNDKQASLKTAVESMSQNQIALLLRDQANEVLI